MSPLPDRFVLLAVAAVVPLLATPAAAQVTFTEVTDEAGLGSIPIGRIAWGDYDNDGDEDLLVRCRELYRNEGPPNWTFTDVTGPSGITASSVAGGVWGDYDNDGFLDIYCPGSSNETTQDPNTHKLWRNNGDGTFTDRADLDGDGVNDHVSDVYNSTAAAWGDGNGDGFLDLYVGNYEWTCTQQDCGRCYPDFYWENNGDGTFADRSVEAGIRDAEAQYPGQEGPGLCVRGVNWGDYDNDGDLDIFVSMYRLDPNLLLENDGTGGFTDVAVSRNVDGDEDSGSWGHVLGSAWGDQDNDGDLDLYTANLAHDIYACSLGHDVSEALENGGGGSNWTFSDRRLPVTAPGNGMWAWNPCDVLRPQPDFAETCPAWGDYDNDGDLDLYVSQIYTSSASNRSHLYGNDGDDTFTDHSVSHGPHLGTYQNYTATWVDYDNDGDLDLATEGADALGQSRRIRLYRNDGGNAAGDWLVVRVRGQATTPGTGTNSAGIGVRVTVTHAGVSRIREVEGGHGYHSTQNSLPLEFGLGTPTGATTVEFVDVRWTDGTVSSYTDVPRNVRAFVYEKGVTLRRGEDPSVDPLPALDPAATLFPYADPVLNDGNSYYYRIDDATATILVDKDEPGGAVNIEIR